MEHIERQLDGRVCEVYFFESWGSYDHPSGPIGPLSYEDAIGRPSYYRAWLCGTPEERIFVMFEGMEQRRRAYPKWTLPMPSEGRSFFKVSLRGEGDVEVGARMTLPETFDAIDYLEVRQENGGVTGASVVHARVRLRYRYRYAKGVLTEVETTNSDGVIKVVPM